MDKCLYAYCNCAFVRMRVYYKSRAGTLIGVVVNRVLSASERVLRVTRGPGQHIHTRKEKNRIIR